MDWVNICFWFFSIIAGISAAAVISVRNPVYAVLCLILTFFSIACVWLLVGAEFLGIALVLIRSRVRWLLLAVLGFLRAIPVVMLIFWSYFLLPIVFKVDVPALATVVCALSLIGGAYLAHSVYAGISSLAPGQWAAGKALGLSTWQVLRLIILPQALPMMLPSFLNQWISLIKDTSLAYVIGVGELSFVATQISNRVMVHPTEIFLFVALVYFVFCSSLDLIANRWVRKPA